MHGEDKAGSSRESVATLALEAPAFDEHPTPLRAPPGGPGADDSTPPPVGREPGIASEPEPEAPPTVATVEPASAGIDEVAGVTTAPPQPASSTAPLESPLGFANALFGRSAPEDLALYTPAGLAKLVFAAHAHLSVPRRPGSHDIRVVDPDPADDPRFGAVTVVEVVNDDMPFLLDSALGQLNDLGHEVHLVAHPIVGIERAPDGTLQRIDPDAAGARRESLIHIHVERLGDPAAIAALVEALDKTFRAVRLATEDWTAMQERVRLVAAAYHAHPPPLPAVDVEEATAFLEWLLADNFVLLGAREFPFDAEHPTPLDGGGGSGLGILRDPSVKVLRRGAAFVDVTPEVQEFLADPHALIVSKANVKSRVHRPVHMDYIGIKTFSEGGSLSGELRVVGLFTSTVYTSPTRTIPYVRRKVALVTEAAHLDPHSHSGKALGNVLETYPRDELFQIDAATLGRFADAIAKLADRPRLRVLARIDRFERFASILVFVPRDRYDTGVRARIGAWLARAYSGRLAAVYPYYPDGPLVRVHFIVAHYEGKVPDIAQSELEAGVGAIVRTWSDELHQALAGAVGVSGSLLAQRWSGAFSAGYMEAFPVASALADIAVVEQLARHSGEAPQFAVVLRPLDDEAPPTRAGLKVFSKSRPMPLSERVPILERMGFRVVSERTFGIGSPKPDDRPGEHPTWLHDMALERAAGGAIDLAQRSAAIEGVLDAVLRGAAESDGYDALALDAGMGWRDIALVRTLSRYLQQARVRFSQDYMAATLVKYAAIADRLVELVYARFDPRPAFTAPERAERERALTADIEAAMASAVMSLDEDRILRRFLNLVQAAVRTNFFQAAPGGGAREAISFKFESRRIDNLPLPQPLYEIFVHSPRVDGVHLRFGKVARGGLRWSDRPQDFRTEVLALVKAQQVKNAVIVPVGAKGGFLPKRLPPITQRDAWMVEGIAAYRVFIGALLDLTDNLDGDTLVPPAATVRHDGDDPYLVVAADKGTATFSDIANALSLEHRHWLGDAFASGGSVGYDHKRMGITARGAWEAVKRHFREIDMDIQSTPFTVAGVGDMSGDVFGNGMLLSPAIRLVAAFDHRDIFIDPDPDPGVGFAERARLFALARSTWQDYDRAALSAGGGIYPRSAREVPLSPQARARLGLATERPSAPEVISAILKAPVDLLWFGGIGTYVRSAQESDDTVGDRANDAVRITSNELRCKVIGEGANLGITQRGRIEAAQRAVRLNTDAIDNAAGVDTSDLEVNIKIALAASVREGRLSEGTRRDLLTMMTEDVASLVLRHNYAQTLALSLAARTGERDLTFARHLMQQLEKDGRLSRAVEFLPDDAALLARARIHQGLTRPELAVVLAYAKLALHDALLESPLPDDPYLERELFAYFPRELAERFPEAVRGHRLRREIIATRLANGVVDRCGPTMPAHVMAETGVDLAEVVRAYVGVRDIFDIEALCGQIDALDARIGGTLQLSLYAGVQDLVQSRVVWFVRNLARGGAIAAAVERLRTGVCEIAETLRAVVSPAARELIDRQAAAFEAEGVPAPLAARMASLEDLQAAPDIVLVAEQSGRPANRVAGIFFAVDAAFGLGVLMHAAATMPVSDYFERLALDAAAARFEAARRRLTATIVAAAAPEAEPAEATATWIRERDAYRRSLVASLATIAGGEPTLAKLTVAAGQLSDLAA